MGPKNLDIWCIAFSALSHVFTPEVDQALSPLLHLPVGVVAPGLLGEVGKHGGQCPPADGLGVPAISVGLTHRGELADSLQKPSNITITRREDNYSLYLR